LHKKPATKLKVRMTDTTVIGNKLGEEDVARNVYCKGKKITKISMITDKNGTPLDVSIYPGSKHDSAIYLDQLDDKSLVNRNLEVKHRGILLADKGYDSSKIRNKLTEKGFTPIIPFNKRNTKDKGKIKHLCGKHKKIYKRRILIEQTFMKLKRNRRIDVRYDRKTITYKGFVMLAVIDIIQKST
jgi:transposase